jgi:hypothetical protein
MSLYDVQCPVCNEIFEINTGEPVCLCPLCFAINTKYCFCNECNAAENCDKECLRCNNNNKKRERGK